MSTAQKLPGGVNADGPLDIAAINILKSYLDLIGKGKNLSEAQQAEFDILAVRLRANGIEQKDDKDLERFAEVIKKLGSISDDVAGKVTGKAAEVLSRASYQLNYITIMLDSINEGIKKIKEAEYSHYEGDIREAISYQDLLTRFANKDGQFDKMTWAGWGDEHRLRAMTEYLEKRTREQQIAAAAPPKNAGKFSVQVITVRNQQSYKFRYLPKFLAEHSAINLEARKSETLYVINARVKNIGKEKSALALEPAFAKLVDSADKDHALLPTFYRFGTGQSFRALGGYDAPSSNSSPYRITLQSGASADMAFIFVVPAGTQASKFKFSVGEVSQAASERTELTFALSDKK